MCWLENFTDKFCEWLIWGVSEYSLGIINFISNLTYKSIQHGDHKNIVSET